MRTCKHIIPILLLILTACQQMENPGQALVEHTLYAVTPGEEAPQLRSALDPSNDRKILWNPHEEISVLAGSGNYLFTGNNETISASAAFTGTGPADLGSYIALYPHNALAGYDGTCVSTTLPAFQTGKAGSFGDGYLLIADDAVGSAITFNHICSGLRFKVSRSDVTSVSIRGNRGEKIAGNFRFSFTEANVPTADNATEESVTLNAPGGYFETGKYYYIVTLPATFQSGITLTAEADGQVGELRFNSSVTFSRGAFKNITGNLNERMSWSTPAGQAYYGPENSFCLRPGESVAIDVSPRKIYGTWQRSGLPATGAAVPASAAVLWGSATASLSGSTLTMGSSSAGSSLVAIKNASGTILWSYLLWVTESAPAETTLPSGAKILPSLGGNLYFQWGRKDPLVPGCPVIANPGSGNALAASLQNPGSFIDQGANGGDWYASGYSNMDGTLWGGDNGSKTVWDPCPAGWRVPSSADFSGLQGAVQDNWNFEKQGTLIANGSTTVRNEEYGWYSYCWSRSTNSEFSVSLLMETDAYNFYGFSLPGNYRYPGMTVRCSKE